MGCSYTKVIAFPMKENSRRTAGMEKAFQLYNAIKKNCFTEARQLISDGVDVNCLNYIGGTPLIETCRSRKTAERNSKRESFVRFLIQHGADTNKNDIYGWNAQMYAAENGHQETAILLENIESRKSKSALLDDNEEFISMSTKNNYVEENLKET